MLDARVSLCGIQTRRAGFNFNVCCSTNVTLVLIDECSRKGDLFVSLSSDVVGRIVSPGVDMSHGAKVDSRTSAYHNVTDSHTADRILINIFSTPGKTRLILFSSGPHSNGTYALHNNISLDLRTK